MNASDIEKTLTELLINTVDSVSEIDINMPLCIKELTVLT